MTKQIFTLLAALFIGSVSQAAIWVEQNQWSDAWEQQYKEWIRANMNTKFFAAPNKPTGEQNPYYGIRVDCADLVYAMRIIFAYENSLPFAMINPVTSRDSFITNQVTRYDRTPEGVPRLKKFLTWVFDLISTASLPKDTYSIAFNQVGPGTIILTSKKNHHSWTIKNITPAGNPHLVYNSTVGRESGLIVQERQSWPNPHWIFEPEVDKLDETKKIDIYKPGSYAGFRYWRPAPYLNQPEILVPGYSDQQHLVGVARWKTVAQASFAKVKETIDQVVTRLLVDACADFQQRVDAVNEAETFKVNLARDLAAGKTPEESSYIKELFGDPNRPSDDRCMTYKKFDEQSTPSRDKRFADALMLARAYYQAGMKKFGAGAFTSANLKIYNEIFPAILMTAAEESAQDKGSRSASYCAIKINSAVGSLSLAEMKRRMFAGRFSSNPNDAPTGRFGYAKTSSDLGASCPAYDFVQKTYNLNAMEKEALNEVASSPALK